MATRATEELYYDSEATLRLVDNVLDELQVMDDGERPPHDADRSAIQNAITNLRDSRSALEHTAVQRIHRTGEQLSEVCSATERATTHILDGIDTALALVDQLETSEGAEKERAALRVELRAELFAVMDCLQFQDVISQQLGYATTVLHDLEERLARLALAFNTIGTQPGPRAVSDTTPHDANRRQAIADEIFDRR